MHGLSHGSVHGCGAWVLFSAKTYADDTTTATPVKSKEELLSTEGSLVIIRAYPALYLSGTPSQETGTSHPSCLLFENCLYMLTLELWCSPGGVLGIITQPYH